MRYWRPELGVGAPALSMRLLNGIRSFPSGRTLLWLSGWNLYHTGLVLKCVMKRGSFLSLLSCKVSFFFFFVKEKIDVLSCVEHPLNRNFPTGPKKAALSCTVTFELTLRNRLPSRAAFHQNPQRSSSKPGKGRRPPHYLSTGPNERKRNLQWNFSLPACERGWTGSLLGFRQAVNTTIQFASGPQAEGCQGEGGALLEASLRPAPFPSSDQGLFYTDNGTKRPPLPRVLMYGMVPLSRTWRPKCKVKNNSKGNYSITSFHPLSLLF